MSEARASDETREDEGEPDRVLTREDVFVLPSGTQIDVASAMGDVERAREFLEALRDGELEDSGWLEIEGLICDLPHVVELLGVLVP